MIEKELTVRMAEWYLEIRTFTCLTRTLINIVFYIQEEEAQRNAENADKLFLHSEENLALQIISSFNNEGSIEQKSSMKVDTGLRLCCSLSNCSDCWFS